MTKHEIPNSEYFYQVCFNNDWNEDMIRDIARTYGYSVTNFIKIARMFEERNKTASTSRILDFITNLVNTKTDDELLYVTNDFFCNVNYPVEYFVDCLFKTFYLEDYFNSPMIKEKVTAKLARFLFLSKGLFRRIGYCASRVGSLNKQEIFNDFIKFYFDKFINEKYPCMPCFMAQFDMTNASLKTFLKIAQEIDISYYNNLIKVIEERDNAFLNSFLPLFEKVAVCFKGGEFKYPNNMTRKLDVIDIQTILGINTKVLQLIFSYYKIGNGFAGFRKFCEHNNDVFIKNPMEFIDCYSNIYPSLTSEEKSEIFKFLFFNNIPISESAINAYLRRKRNNQLELITPLNIDDYITLRVK